MQDYFRDENVPERISDAAKKIRQSEAYPAVLGAIAGGIAGALVAALIAGMLSSRRGSSANGSADAGAAKSNGRGGWSPRDVLELLAVGAGLAKQVRELIAEKVKK